MCEWSVSPPLKRIRRCLPTGSTDSSVRPTSAAKRSGQAALTWRPPTRSRTPAAVRQIVSPSGIPTSPTPTHPPTRRGSYALGLSTPPTLPIRQRGEGPCALGLSRPPPLPLPQRAEGPCAFGLSRPPPLPLPQRAPGP